MSNWITPKTNWTSADFINFGDLNRIEENTKFVAERLREYGYYVIPLVHKTNWTMDDIVFFNDLNRIEQNIKNCAEAYYTGEEFEALKTDWATLDPVTFSMPNRLEKDLKIINDLITSMSQYYIHSGVGMAGRNRVANNMFRRY